MSKVKLGSCRVLASLAVAVGVAGLVVYYAVLGEEQAPPLTEEARASRAALARIEAESRGVLQEPRIQAAP